MATLKEKIILAPILGIVLALLLAGTIISMPIAPVSSQPSPQPGHGQEMGLNNGSTTFFAFFIAAVVLVCIITALIFFREKRALNEEK